MTNEQLQALKKYINMSAVIKSLPVKIPNCMEKLARSNGKGKGKYHKERRFTPSELLYIEGVLLAIAQQINENRQSSGKKAIEAERQSKQLQEENNKLYDTLVIVKQDLEHSAALSGADLKLITKVFNQLNQQNENSH